MSACPSRVVLVLVVFVHTVVVVVVIIAGVVAAVVIVIVEAIAVIVVAVVIADVIAVVIVAIAVVIAIAVVVVIVVDVVVVATTSWSRTGSVSKVVWVNITTQHKQANNMRLPPWTQPQRWLGHGVLLDMKKTACRMIQPRDKMRDDCCWTHLVSTPEMKKLLRRVVHACTLTFSLQG